MDSSLQICTYTQNLHLVVGVSETLGYVLFRSTFDSTAAKSHPEVRCRSLFGVFVLNFLKQMQKDSPSRMYWKEL